MVTKTIKHVDKNTWRKFKALAASEDMVMGLLLKKMIDVYDQEAKSVWDTILTGKRILTDREADEVLNETKRMRKEYGFRT